MPDRQPPSRTTTRPEQRAVVPSVFRELPENASIEQLVQSYGEMARAYATIAAGYTSQLPKIIADQEEFRVVQEAHGVRIGRLEIWKDTMQSLPPMRAESPSTADMAKHASKEIGEKVAAEISNPSTPPPSVDKVAALSEDVLKVAIARVKREEAADKWEALEQERKRAEDERIATEKSAKATNEALALANTKAKNKAFWAIVVASVVGVGTVVREIIERIFAHH